MKQQDVNANQMCAAGQGPGPGAASGNPAVRGMMAA